MAHLKGVSLAAGWDSTVTSLLFYCSTGSVAHELLLKLGPPVCRASPSLAGNSVLLGRVCQRSLLTLVERLIIFS